MPASHNEKVGHSAQLVANARLEQLNVEALGILAAVPAIMGRNDRDVHGADVGLEDQLAHATLDVQGRVCRDIAAIPAFERQGWRGGGRGQVVLRVALRRHAGIRGVRVVVNGDAEKDVRRGAQVTHLCAADNPRGKRDSWAPMGVRRVGQT